MTIRTVGLLALLGSVGVGATACEDDPTGFEPETALLSVAPAGGAVDVATDGSVVLTFDHAMHAHATDYAAVHEGDVTGPMVVGMWTMEGNGTILRFTPDHPWKAATMYTIHLGGGMRDAGGHMVDLERHGMAMGGAWSTGGMMNGGMMGGGHHPHMGDGWEHANGSYGMLFTFTTAAP